MLVSINGFLFLPMLPEEDVKAMLPAGPDLELPWLSAPELLTLEPVLCDSLLPLLLPLLKRFSGPTCNAMSFNSNSHANCVKHKLLSSIVMHTACVMGRAQ